MNFLLVFIGGGIGCVLRYIIGLGFLKTTASLPLATFVSNIVACGVFAITVWLINTNQTLNQQAGASVINIKLLVLTGFCGGLSTFSTFGYESFLMFKQGMHLYAFINVIFTTVICLAIFYIFNRQTV